MKLLSLMSLIFFIALLTGCDREPNPKNMTRGDQLYAYYCQECHTYRGLGAQLQNLPPGVSQLQVHDVVLIVKHGAQLGHPMGTFPGLTDEQAFTVAEYAVAMRRQIREQQLDPQPQD